MTAPHFQNLQETESGDSLSGSPLYNKDFAPVASTDRNWGTWNFASLWIGMAVCIPTYMLAGSMIREGMNWWQALLTILLGNLVVLLPMILNAHAGTKYGLPLPVLLRAGFGTKGAVLAALMRGLVGCGWFGIQTWIGGEAIYTLLMVPFPDLVNAPMLSFIGLNTAQLACFLAFWLLNMWIIFRGIETIRLLESWTAPLLLLMGVALLIWAINKVGSLSAILEASHQMKGQEQVSFWKIFWPNLTAMVGFWATLSLNIPDFSRFARNQRAQVLGQAIGLPPTMVFYSFIGIIVTSATLLIFGEAIWDPVQLLGRFSSPVVVVISMLGLTVATLSTNIAANVVASANDIANIAPRKISFRMGGYITGLIGILIFPWKLLADPQGFIFVWLIGYSALLGALAGVMICDYYIIRKSRLNLKSLFASNGEYGRWNKPAWIALSISLLPVLPGFLAQTTVLSPELIPDFLQHLYKYAWFVTFFLAFTIYWILKTKSMKQSIRSLSPILLIAISPMSYAQTSIPSVLPSDLAPAPTVTVLAELINQRLSYMKDVAAYKWQHQLPIEDLVREQVVLQSSIEQAATFGLDSASTQSFFEEQITAAKLIQQYWFDHWEATGFDQQMNFRDLNTEVRPALLDLGDQILAAISEVKLWEKPPFYISKERFNFITSLTTEGLRFKEKRILYEAANQIRGTQKKVPSLH